MAIPSLALCIPAYNAAAFLPQLLASAQAQTRPFTEIWVYDDCSTDSTSEVAAAYGAQIIRGEKNRGCSWGKNVLAQQTQCDWIHFHDADDALYPNFVEAAQDWMVQADAPDVVLFSYEYREQENSVLIDLQQFDDQALRRDAIAYCIRTQINPFCGLYRRESFLDCGGYDIDPQVLYNEDVAFHCRLAIAGAKFAADPRITVINYRCANSMSQANAVRCLRAQYQVMAKVAAALPGQYQSPVAQRLWEIAGVSAACSDWQNADACVTLARQLVAKPNVSQYQFFNQLCTFQPYLALRLREYLIRQFKPDLRLSVIAA